MKHILPTLLFLTMAAQVLADDTLIYSQTVSIDTIFSQYDNVEIIAHNTITLDAGFTFSSNGNGAFTANADPWNIEEPPYIIPSGNSYDSTGTTHDGSHIVGTINGQPGVSPTGACTYSIPLELPPGNKNMVPQLAITYNSQAGNGILGRGWNLSGISSIVATGKTRYYDNESTVVSSEDTACRLMWDGQRLLALNSAGLDADSFRTEMVNNVKITKKSETGYEWFEVKTPDGHTLEYGKNSDSRMTLDSNTQWKWMLNRIYPRTGGSIKFTYTTDTDKKSILLSKVEYGGPYFFPENEISFSYTSRSDISYGYIHDDLIVNDQLLDEITIESDNKACGSYKFEYDTTGNETLLDEIIQYDKDNLWYNATQIDWESASSSFTPTETTVNIVDCLGDTISYFTGDFTGDGIFDLVAVDLDVGMDIFKYYLYKGTSTGLPSSWDESGDLPRSYTNKYWDEHTFYIESDSGCDYSSSPPIRENMALEDISYVFSGDFDGDGVEELFVKVMEWEELYDYLPGDLNTGFTATFLSDFGGFYDLGDICTFSSYFTTTGPTMQLLEGIGHFLNFDKSSGSDERLHSFRLGQGIKYEEQYSQFPDIDGRGYNSFPDNNSIVYYDPIEDTAIAFCSITADDDLRWAEFNGDGKADYIDPANENLRVYTYNASTNSFGSALYNSGYLLGTIDFNGDGISAFVALGDVEYEVMTYDDLWDEWCDDNDSNCSVTDPSDWSSYLSTYDLEDEYDTYDDDPTNCPFGDDQICRLGFIGSGDTIHRSIGRELFAKHLSEQGPDVSFGYFEESHEPSDPLFTRAVGTDINADGKNELLLFSQSQLVNIYHSFTPTYSNGSISLAYETEQVNSNLSYRFQFGDFNGDGIFELIYPKSDKLLTYATGKPGALVSSITNGLGVESRYSYEPLTSSSVYSVGSDAAFPVIDFTAPWYVVSSISSDNGVADSSFVEYNYQGAKIHLQGKGFLGFMQTTVENDLLNTSQISSSEYDSRFFHTYPVSSTQKVGTSNVRISTSSTNVDSIAPYKYMAETDTVVVNDVLANTTTISTYTYNSDGLVSEKKSDIDGDATITEKYTYTSGGWHVSALPSSVATTYQRGGDTETDSTSYTYNTTNGLLTKKKEYCGTDRELTTSYRNYDSFGNPKTIATSGKRGLGLSVDSVEITMTYSSDYRFLESRSGPLNHKETFDISTSTGLLESKTGSNRKETSYEYGPFNRLKKTTHPDRMEELSALSWTDDDTDDKPTGALYYKWTSNSSSPPIKIFYDAMGRELRTVSTGFGDESIYVDTEYDSQGRVKRKSNPYFSTGTSYWTRTTYDNYGRTDSIITADTTITKYSYSNLTTTVTTKKGTTTTTTKQKVNALGETVESEDNLNNKVYHSYYPDGKLKYSYLSAHNSDSITFSYDAQGNRTKINDPDAGTITSLYDAFGQLLRQINANDDTTTYQYDKLGRMTRLSDDRGDINYGYVTDTSSAAFGMVDSVYLVNGSIHEVFEYDSDYGRLTTETRSSSSKTFENTYTYDWFGRPSTRTYPSDFEIQYAYTSNGDLDQVTGEGLTLWSCSDVNALGQVTSYSQGSNSTSVTYNIHGELNRVSTNTGTLVDMYYGFDDKGNLQYRSDNNSNQKEVFDYDNLDRLTGIEYYDNGTHQTAYDITMVYDNCGNITSKTGVSSSINYGEGNEVGPHALTSIDNPDTDYYPPPQGITYNHFNKVTTISDTLSGGVPLSLEITYGLSNQRIKTVQTRDSSIERVKYFDIDYEEDSTSSGHKKYHYIYGGTGLTAIFVMEGTGNDTMHYVLSDHLGSLTGIVNAATSAVTKYSFNAWGIPRDASDWTKPDTSYLFAGRGYTGHEHLTDFNLINMNGRVYDPILGRFLSPDPYVQAPDYPNNYNRYTYALNNPLIYTDPSGEFIFSFFLPGIGTLIDAACWGAVFGGYSGYKIGKAYGATGAKMFGYVAGGALIGGAAGIAGASIGTAAAAGASGIEAAMTGGMMGGISAGAINGGGMTALAGGSFNDVIAGLTQGAVIGGFSGLAAGSAHFGTEHMLEQMHLFKSINNPFARGLKEMAVGKNPLHNTLSYMAGSTASQVTSNVFYGKGLLEDVDFGMNLGLIVPLFADVGSKFKGIREYQLRKQYESVDGYEIKSISGAAPGTHLQENGDLTVGTIFSTEKYIPEHYRTNFFGRKVLVSGDYHTKIFNNYDPILIHNYRGLIYSLIGLR